MKDSLSADIDRNDMNGRKLLFLDPSHEPGLCSYLTCHPPKYFSLTNKHALKANLFCSASLSLADKEGIVGKKAVLVF